MRDGRAWRGWCATLIGAVAALTVSAAVGRADGPKAAADYVRPPPPRLSLPAVPGDHKLKYTTQIGSRTVTLSYLLHLPPAYTDRSRRLPLVVFYHGIGECGSDLSGVLFLGPMSVFKTAGDSANPAMAANCPFAILCPQCPAHGEQWETDYIARATAELVDGVVHSGRFDADRVYGTGLSMGGRGTWCVADLDPDLFAAVVPQSAMQWQPETAGERLKATAVWTITGKEDEPRFVDGNRAMERALTAMPTPGVDRRFTYADDGHRVFEWAYTSPQIYEWMLGRRRPDPHHPAAATDVVPTAPGHYLLTYDGKLGEEPVQIDYVLYVPKPSAAGPNKRAAVLSLCERDTIGPDFRGICCHGPDLALERHPTVQSRYPMVVISPRLPLRCGWDTPGVNDLVAGLLDHVMAALPIDPDRVSVTGIDDGGTAAWRLAAAMPDRFAAVQWVSTKPDAKLPDGWEATFAKLPGRASVANAEVRRTLTDRARHDHRDWAAAGVPPGATPLSDLFAYTDSTTISWLARQRRPAAK